MHVFVNVDKIMTIGRRLYFIGVGSEGICPHFFYWGGDNGISCLPILTPHFLFSHLNYVYIALTINSLFDIFHIPINYFVEHFNKLTQMAVT